MWSLSVASAAFSMVKTINDQKQDDLMQKNLSPKAYKEWKSEKTAERRHQEMCSAIRSVKQEVNVNRYYF